MFSDEQLLNPQFDESAYMNYLLHTSSVSGSGSATEQARLKRCMDTVMSRIKLIFSEDADSLVDEVKATYEAQQQIEDVCRSTQSLTRATNRLRVMIEEPYLNVQQRVQELENTTHVAEALEAVQKLLGLCGRLKHYQSQPTAGGAPSSSSSPSPSPSTAATAGPSATETARLAPPQELLRDARTLKEIELLLAEHAGASSAGFDLREVDAVAAQMKVTEQASTAIRGRVRELLSVQDLLQCVLNHSGASGETRPNASSDKSGASGNPYNLREDPLTRTVQNVGLSLQCSHILGGLARTIQQFMAERKREVIKVIVRDLDQQRIADQVNTKLQGYKSSSSSSSDAEANRVRLAATQEVLLTQIQQVLLAVVQQSQCVILFWCALLEQDTVEVSTLSGSSTAAVSVPLARTVDAPVQLLSDFWHTTMDKMREALNSLQRRTELQVALVSNYPRYHRLLAYFLGSYCTPLLAPLFHGSTALPSSSPSSSLPRTGGPVRHEGRAGLSSRACPLFLQHLPQCGMGDVLLLLQVVERESPSSSSSGASWTSAPLATVRAQCGEWTRDVTAALEQRFTQQVMEHHNQRLNVVLAALAEITPTSTAQASQPTDVCVRDLQHPSLPAATTLLQAHQYTQIVVGDIQAYRHDIHTVCLLLRCATRCLGQISDKFKASCTRWPLPPLPAITASVTRGQILHVCIANACTSLSFDIANALSLLPAVSSTSPAGVGATATSGNTANATATSPDETSLSASTDDENALVTLRGQLWDLTTTFRTMSESLSQPFLRSLRVTIGNAIQYCVEQATAVAPAAGRAGEQRPLPPSVSQLRDQLTHFSGHFFFLFDPRTSEWAGACRGVSDALLARLLASITTAPVPSSTAALPSSSATGLAPAMRACWHRCLGRSTDVLLEGFQRMQSNSVGGGARARRSLLLRGATQQTCAMYAVAEWVSPSACAMLSGLVQSVAPLLGRLVLVQQATVEACQVAASKAAAAAGPGFTPISLANRLKQKDEAVLDALEGVLMALYNRDDTAEATPPTTAVSPAALDAALHAAFEEATATLVGAGAPVASTLKTLWASVAPAA